MDVHHFKKSLEIYHTKELIFFLALEKPWLSEEQSNWVTPLVLVRYAYVDQLIAN